MENNTNNNFEEQDDALDLLLKERTRRHQLEELKRQIPMPVENGKNLNIKKVLPFLLLALLIAVVVIYSFAESNNSPRKMAEEFIAESQMVDLRDMNKRGQEGKVDEVQALEIDFYKAHDLLKGDSIMKEQAVVLLSEITKSKNKFQIESLWLKSLALTALGKNDLAHVELNKLKAFSNYQNKNVNSLLKLLDK